MTYGILFSLVLLNTDLNIANIGAKQSRKMTKKDFLKNTMDLAWSMIENNPDLKDWSKSDKKKEWKKDLQSLLKVF
jgi:Sec7-like guanine-nucleotide exchange factor